MDIALAFDLAFARYAMATMESVSTRGSSGDDSIDWWLMPGGDIPPSTLDVITRWAGQRGTAHVLRVPAELDTLPLSSWRVMSSRISNAAYYRLLLPELVPESVRRVLYLDADLMCTGDLSSLWETDLQGALMAAATDPGCPTVSAAGGIPGFDAQHQRLTVWSDYFNSGVLLMDLPRCREEQVSAHSLKYIREHASRLRFAVQDALNLAVDDQWFRLDTRWNDVDYRGYEQNADATRDPRILHFAGPKKPWQAAFREGEVKALYQRYLDSVPELGVAR